MNAQAALFTDPLCDTEMAAWCAEHPQAVRYIRGKARWVNDHEKRDCSMRLDCEPQLAHKAREYGLDKGTYRGIDHRITRRLALYLEACHGVRFALRDRKPGEGR